MKRVTGKLYHWNIQHKRTEVEAYKKLMRKQKQKKKKEEEVEKEEDFEPRTNQAVSE